MPIPNVHLGISITIPYHAVVIYSCVILSDVCCVYLATSQAQPISTVQYYFRLQRGDEDDAELPRVAVGRGRAADGEGDRFELRFAALY